MTREGQSRSGGDRIGCTVAITVLYLGPVIWGLRKEVMGAPSLAAITALFLILAFVIWRPRRQT